MLHVQLLAGGACIPQQWEQEHLTEVLHPGRRTWKASLRMPLTLVRSAGPEPPPDLQRIGS